MRLGSTGDANCQRWYRRFEAKPAQGNLGGFFVRALDRTKMIEISFGSMEKRDAS
jgi:hypothetical protein